MRTMPGYDPLYEEAVNVVMCYGRISATVLQRRLSIGYNRAKTMVKLMNNESFITTSGEVTTLLEAAKKNQKVKKEEYVTRKYDEEESNVDPILESVMELIKKKGYITTKMLRKEFKIGYPRAARIMDELIMYGIVRYDSKTRKNLYCKDY